MAPQAPINFPKPKQATTISAALSVCLVALVPAHLESIEDDKPLLSVVALADLDKLSLPDRVWRQAHHNGFVCEVSAAQLALVAARAAWKTEQTQNSHI